VDRQSIIIEVAPKSVTGDGVLLPGWLLLSGVASAGVVIVAIGDPGCLLLMGDPKRSIDRSIGLYVVLSIGLLLAVAKLIWLDIKSAGTYHTCSLTEKESSGTMGFLTNKFEGKNNNW
jgi:hypothetical protein